MAISSRYAVVGSRSLLESFKLGHVSAFSKLSWRMELNPCICWLDFFCRNLVSDENKEYPQEGEVQ